MQAGMDSAWASCSIDHDQHHGILRFLDHIFKFTILVQMRRFQLDGES